MIVLSAIHDIREFIKKINEDYVSAFSAQAAFFILISFFPFIMFLLTLLQYLPIRESELLEFCIKIFPGSLNSFVFSIIKEINEKASGTLISVTVITALWSASRGILSIIRGLNAIYAIKETRNYIKLRAIAAFYTFIFAIMIVVTLSFLVFGNQIYTKVISKFTLLDELALFIISIRTVAGLGILIIFFLVLYIAVPNRRSNLFAELPGAFISSIGWMGFSYLYSFYIDNMGNFSYMYGSLTAIVLLMLWLYFCMYIMFIGAELNVRLQEKRPFFIFHRKSD